MISSAVPWIIMGDFNVIKADNEKKGGRNIDKQAVLEFNDCLEAIGATDLRYSGCQFTWCNKQAEGSNVFCKLDRTLVNEKWLSSFPFAETYFPHPGISDHCPVITSIRQSINMGKKPFKFFNFWTRHGSYPNVVEETWSQPTRGSPLFKLCSKLKLLKVALKAFNSENYGSLPSKVLAAKAELSKIQEEMQVNPSQSLIDREVDAMEAYSKLALAEEAFFKQKARDNIIKVGDLNTSYFHRKVKSHFSRNKILSIVDAQGRRCEDYDKVKSMFIDHYKNLLGTTFEYPNEALPYVIEMMQTEFPQGSLPNLEAEVTEDEIKSTLFSLNGHKAPGPDGFTSHFFKASWNIVGEDFVAATKDFFQSSKLPIAINSTIIALVPKVPNPTMVTDFRPISCCTTIYKCITKIIANRLKGIMPFIISPSQAAFVQGRSISDQILLMQELVRNYHRPKLSPRCALKIDLMKAFDSVSWDLLSDILQALNLPRKFQEWIKACITTPYFSISINGALEGFFPGARGLRQGDPLSPYLFLLAMEFFSRIFNNLAKEGDFAYHPKCSEPLISHICFADDLFILCSPNIATFHIIRKALLEFHKFSGLQPNGFKSQIYISGLDPQDKQHLCSILGFQLSELPVKYLGVPLISTKLKYGDCKILMDKITKRIQSWSSKILSYAGRLVLIKAVLFSIQIYWSMHFLLPKRVCNEIEQILRRFLWSGTELQKGGSKVAWDEVCLPAREGGLGLCKLHDWNKAAMMRHLWNLCSHSPSLWVSWCHANLLKGKCFWEIKMPADCSWTWRKLLKLRGEAINLSKYIVGNGKSISLWFANWHPMGPLIPKYSPRVAYDAGIHSGAKVAKVIENGQWKWPYPTTWELRDIVESLPEYNPQLHKQDQFIWIASRNGLYNVASTWNSIRKWSQKVTWHSLLWSSHHIPRHSFILWLAIKGKLTTKDKVIDWGMNVDPTCVLCGNCPETLQHLLFSCSFSACLRKEVLQRCSIVKASQPWADEIKWAIGKFSGKSFCKRMGKIAWVALTYHIWKERNARIHGGSTSSIACIVNNIKHEVRLKASQFPAIKSNLENMTFCNLWEF